MAKRNNAPPRSGSTQMQFIDVDANEDQLSFVDLDCVDDRVGIWGRVVAVAHCPKCGRIFEVIQK